jgi:hypothetical protein
MTPAINTGERWSPRRLTQTIHDQARCPTLLMAWRPATGDTQPEIARWLQEVASERGAGRAVSSLPTAATPPHSRDLGRQTP